VSSDIATPGSHRIIVVSVVVAAGAITLCALVAIAYMFGWIPARNALSTPASFASPAQQVAGTAPGVALLPNESIVAPESPSAPAKPAPTIPDYSRPAPSKAIEPAAPAQTAPPVRDAKPGPAARDPKPEPTARDPKPEPAARAPTPAPNPPRYARDSYCVNCGTVIAITAYRDEWEVRVKFQDGGVETFRYRSSPDVGMGQRVRLEGDRLVRDR
jgi:hypothetical protein